MKLQLQDNIKRYANYREFWGKPWDARTKRAFGFLSEEKISNILDVGARNNNFLSFFPDSVKKYGVDLFKEKGKAKNKGIISKIADVEREIPFGDGFFDAIFAGDIIEHLFDTDAFLQECSRVLKPGGAIVITTPNLCSLNNLVFILRQRQLYFVDFDRQGYTHLRYYCFSSLREQMERHGFRVEKHTGGALYLPFWTRSRAISQLSEALAKIFPCFAKHMIVKARKVQDS